VNCISYKFDSFFIVESSNWLKENFIHVFLEYLAREINILYSNLRNPIERTRIRISELDEIIQKYHQRELEALRSYFRDIQRVFFSSYPPIYFSIHWMAELSKNIKEFDKNKKSILTKFPYSRDLIDNFQLIETELALLKNELYRSLDMIKSLILQKRECIKTFTKPELTKKLNTLHYEKDFRNEILIPILEDLGYENIQEYHGQHEYGIDILFSNQNKFGIREWNGIVAKVGDINLQRGTEINRNMKKILTQIYQAKNMDHLEKNYGNVKITRVFIATNGKINHQAKEAFSKEEPLIEGNIFFIDKNLLLSLF